MGLLTDQILGNNQPEENPAGPEGTMTAPVVPQQQPASSGLVRDVLGETNEVTRLGMASRAAQHIAPERAARVIELGDKTRLPLDMIQRNFDEVDKAARASDFDPVKFRRDSPAVAKWMSEDPNNAALAAQDMGPLSMTERLVNSLRKGVINRSYDLTVAQNRLGKLRARQLMGEVLSPEESREADTLSANMDEMANFAQEGAPWLAKSVLSGGIQTVLGILNAQDVALAGGTVGAGVSALAGPGAPAVAPITAGSGYVTGLQGGLMRETFQVEAGSAYDEFLKIRGEDGQPIDPQVARYAAMAVGAMNAPLELLAFRSIVKTIPGGARVLSFFTKDAIREALEKQTVRAAIARAIKAFGTATVENAAQEALQETATILGGEVSKKLSPGKFESPSLGQQVKRVGEAAAAGAVMGGGLGLPGTVVTVNQEFARARQAAQAEATFKALGEAVAESKTFQRLPAKTQEIVARMTKDGPLETVYAPVDTWNTYWQEKGLEPRAMAREVLGDVKAYDEAVAAGHDMAIPTALYATKLAATEHNEFFQSELRTGPEAMNAREANEFLAQVEAATKEAEAGAAPAINESAGRVGADIQQQLQVAGFEENVAGAYARLYASSFQALGERTGQDPFTLYQRYGLKVQRRDETTIGRVRPGTTQLEATAPVAQAGQPQSGAVPGQSTPGTISQPPSSEGTQGAGVPQRGLPIHPLSQGQAAESAYRLKAPFSESITSHPQFRKYFSDADAVVRFYANKFGREVTPEFALQIGEEIHQDLRAIYTGKTAEDKAAARAAVKEKYKGMDINEVGKDMALLRSVSQGVMAHAPGLEAATEQYVRKGLDAYAEEARPRAAVDAEKAAGEQTLEQGPAAQDPRETGPARATFLGWQDQGSFGPPIALYNIRGEHPRTGSTVQAKTLEALGITVPLTPSFEEWKSGGSKVNLEQAPYEQRKGNEARGRIRFGNERQFSIDLLKNADLSTFLHETGHFYLEVMGDLAEAKDAPADLKADYDAILKHLGVKDRSGLGREQHEEFARSFEAYLMEGKAPSSALRQAFAKFRAWLISVYQQVKNLNVGLKDDVRGVFDRLVATKGEIAAAEAEARLQPLFEDPRSVGMNEVKAAAYSKAVDEARQAAEEELTSRVLRDWQREQKKWWKDARDKVRAEVEAEVNQRKEYIAQSVLQRGTFPGGEALPEGMEPMKLSKEAIVQQYGEDRLKSLPLPYMYAAVGGVHPDVAADVFGFTSGDELLKALAGTVNRKALIEAVTDQKMTAAYGDILKEGKLPQAAMKAVHTKKRAQLLQMELEHLASNDLPVLKEVVRRVSRRVPPLEAVTAQAEKIIAAKAIRDLAPTAYQQAETRAARAATEAMLRGDFAAAFDFKQKELLNHELFKAATDAREEADGIVDYMRKFARPEVRERLGKAGGDYLAQIDAILDRYDFRRSTTLTALDRRKSLAAWVEEQRAQGYDVQVPENVLNDAYRRHYKDTPFEELQGVRDSVKTIEHLARLKNELLANEKLRELEAARDEIVASIGAHHEIAAKPIDFAPGIKARFLEKVREGVAAHTRMEFLFEHLDGNKPQGPVWQAFFKPMAEAEDSENQMVQDAGKELNDIFSAYTRKERIGWFMDKVHIPEIGNSMNKANMLAVALNWGNEYNRQALMEGYGWNEGQVQAILKKLDRRDWETVQKIWDFIDSYWGQIEAMEKELNGVAPKKVERAPFTADVMGAAGPEKIEMSGGYYPIVFDSKLSWRQSVLDEAANVKEMFGGNWARSMTRHGHTIERTNTGGKPLRLDLTGLTQHLTNVIHDLAFRRPVIDVSKIARDPDVRLAIEGAAGREMYRQINPWIAAIAGDRRGEPMNPIEGLLGRARMGVTTAALGLKVTSGLVQSLGYTLTTKELGLEYAARGLRDAYSNPKDLRKTWDFITDRSDMMKGRIENWDRDIRDALKGLNVEGTKPGPLGALDAYTFNLRRSFFTFIGLMDLGVSIPTWLGAYRKGMDGKVENVAAGDEKSAADYADSVVRKTQSAGAAKDLAAIQRGSEAFKIFTMFYSQLSLQFNQFASAFNQYRLDKNMGKLVGAAGLLWFLPAVLEDVLRGRAPDSDDDPEKLAKWFARKQVLYPFSSVVLLRDLANGLDRYLETGVKDFQGSPIFDVGSSLVGLASLLTKPFSDQDISRGDVKNAVMAAGYLFALPTRQTWQTLEYLYDWMTGNETPNNAMEGIWRALVTGKKRD